MVVAPVLQIRIAAMEVVTAATLPPTVQAIAAQLAMTEFAMAPKIAAGAQVIAVLALGAEMEVAMAPKIAPRAQAIAVLAILAAVIAVQGLIAMAVAAFATLETAM